MRRGWRQVLIIAFVTLLVAVPCAMVFGPLALFVVAIIGGVIAFRFVDFHPFRYL